MSGFDENPFADPSIQQAAKSTPAPSTTTYDPFNKDNQKTVSGTTSPPPAVLSPTQEAPPPRYDAGPQQTATTADFQRRQEELERKAAELAKREEELRASAVNARINNWPPLPSFIPCQPCFYQDINVDIPVEFQEHVKRLYYLWLFHALVILLNLFAGACLLFDGLDDGRTFGMSIVYVVFNIPLSFLCWFRPVYKAFRDDSSISFMIFFLTFAAQFLFGVVMAIGIPSTGGCGFITAIVTFQGGKRQEGATGGDYFVGFIVILVAVGFALSAAADFFMLTKVHGLYRATGASVAKAQAEFASGVMNNDAARNAAAAGMSSAFQNAAQNQNPGGRF